MDTESDGNVFRVSPGIENGKNFNSAGQHLKNDVVIFPKNGPSVSFVFRFSPLVFRETLRGIRYFLLDKVSAIQHKLFGVPRFIFFRDIVPDSL